MPAKNLSLAFEPEPRLLLPLTDLSTQLDGTQIKIDGLRTFDGGGCPAPIDRWVSPFTFGLSSS